MFSSYDTALGKCIKIPLSSDFIFTFVVFLRSSFAMIVPLSSLLLGTAIMPSHSISAMALPSLASNNTSLTAIIDTFEQPHFTFNQLYSLTERFWDNFVFPANVNQSRSINSNLFAEDVIGRVDATRTFYGRELNTEYIFGSFGNLALNPSILSLFGVPLSHQLVHFAATQNIASAAELILFNLTLINEIVPVEVDTWFEFNAQGEISEYDASFRWLAWVIDYLLDVFTKSLGAGATDAVAISELASALATQICQTASTYCIGALSQYESFSDCTDFLTTKIRFGKAYEMGMNTLICRSLHELMLPLRPEVHCPHVGKSGGDMCIDDLTYAQKVLQPVFTNAPFVPLGCHSSDVAVAEVK
jgi:hypothetical protein